MANTLQTVASGLIKPTYVGLEHDAITLRFLNVC